MSFTITIRRECFHNDKNNVSRETFPIFGVWTQDNVSRETI